MNRDFTDFRGFTCWNATSADEVLVVDAPMSSEGVFAATHFPMQISERSFDSYTDPSQGTFVSESDLMDRLLAESPTGLTFLPIVGASGTGKSHLVRWIYSQLPPNEQRKDVYIKRYQTSLRAVIEEVISGLDGDLFDTVRRELETASAGVNPVSAPRRLLSELANTILEDADHSDSDDQAFLKDAWSRILGDPVIVDHLLGRDAKIQAFIERRLAGAEERETAQLQLEVTDLPHKPQHWSGAAEPTRVALGRINGDARLRDASLDLLNRHLERAVQRLFGVGSRDLRSVFVEARRALQEAGMELLIAVEDFVVLQGIQGDLLDALLEPARREGRLELCPVRALVAVTTGYFGKLLPDTAETRAEFTGSVYSLDIDVSETPGSESIGTDSLHSFVARYLNAARVGTEKLDAAYRGGSGQDWVPNACSECPHQDYCHESFGSVDGVGLYPLNGEVLNTMAKRIGSTFDPRRMLGVTRRILGRDSAIQAGRFPDAEFQQAMPRVVGEGLDNLVSQDIDRLDPTNRSRRKLLLEFWGGNPPQLVNLSTPVHVAFDLPKLEGLTKDREREEVEAGESEEDGEPEANQPSGKAGESEWELTSPSQELLRNVDRWSKGARLVQKPAQAVRELLARNVVGSVNWNAEFASRSDEWLDEIFGSFAISLENAQGEGLSRPPSTHLVKLEATTDSALLIEGLIKYEEFGSWGFARGADFHRIFLNWVDSVADGLLDRLHDRAERLLGPLIETLALEAIILGANVPRQPTLVDVKNLAFSTPENIEPHGVVAWQNVMKIASEGRHDAWDRKRMTRELEYITGARQGLRGKIHAVDYIRMESSLDSSRRNWSVPYPNENLPAAFDKHLRVILDAFEKALDAQLTDLEDFYLEVAPLISSDESLEDVIDSFVEAANDARVKGMLRPPRFMNRYRRVADDLREKDIHILGNAGVALNAKRTLGRLEQICLAAIDRGEGLKIMRNFVSLADEVLSSTQQKVTREIGDITGGSNDELAQDFGQLLDELRERLDELP